MHTVPKEGHPAMKEEKRPVSKKKFIIILIVSIAVSFTIGFYGSALIDRNLFVPLLIAIVAFVLIFFLYEFAKAYKRVGKNMAYYGKREEVLKNLVNIEGFITPDEFSSRYRYNSSKDSDDGSGVYLIFNMTKKECHVRTSKDIVEDVHSQLNGQKEEEIYAGLKNGDEIVIKLVWLKDSGFNSLGELEGACHTRIKDHSRGNWRLI